MRMYVIVLAEDGSTIEKIYPTGKLSKSQMYTFLSECSGGVNSIHSLELVEPWVSVHGSLDSLNFSDIKNFLQRKTADPSGTSVFLYSKKDNAWYHTANLLSESMEKVVYWE